MKPRIKVAACDLRLFLAKKNGAFLNEAEASAVFLDEHGDLNGFDTMMASLYLKNSNHFGADFKPDEGQIHVLVSPVVMVPTRELPSTYLVSADQGHPGSGPDGGAWMFEKGWTEKWLAKFCKSQLSQQQLPVVGDRAEFISNELPDKITMHQETYDQWVNKMTFPSLELMAKLFRIENSEQCVDFVSMINVRILHPTTPDNDSFVSFWDDIIRSTLNFVLPSGKTSRYSRRSRPIGSRRPDYLFTVDSVCVFRGEEEDPGEEMETPELKLITKLFWSYGGAPYVFGYAAVGYDVKLYAITHASDANHAIELGSYNLRHLEGRFRLLLVLLNAAQLLPSVVKMCPESARDEYKTLDRDLGIKVYLEPSCVIKYLPEPIFTGALAHIETVYRLLEDHDIPYVDHLACVDKTAKHFVFNPRGQEKTPATLEELFCALENVLEALVKLHAASWMHRNICWPNVIKSRSDNSWFLIDFMDAAQSPQASASGQHLSPSEHAPEIFSNDSHTTAVGVWSVGRLIENWGGGVYENWYDTMRTRTQFLQLLMDDDPSRRPTAVAALNLLRQLQCEYFKRASTRKSTFPLTVLI